MRMIVRAGLFWDSLVLESAKSGNLRVRRFGIHR